MNQEKLQKNNTVNSSSENFSKEFIALIEKQKDIPYKDKTDYGKVSLEALKRHNAKTA